MNAIEKYVSPQFGEIRTTLKNGEPWFVAVDICRALEIGNSRMATDRLDADEKAAVSLTDTSSNGVVQQRSLVIVSEAGLYALILGSRKPEARAFKRWVTHEVIPSIRKHGVYATPETLEKMIVSPEFGIRLLQEIKAEREKRGVLELTAAAQQKELTEIRPKAAYFDLILQNPETLTTTQIAKDYGMSAIMFNRLLQELGIQYKQNGVWTLYQQYTPHGYTKSRTEQINSNGRVITFMSWTQKGRKFLYEHLKANANGLVPMIERESVI